MDRNDLRDNGRLDLHQNFTEYTTPRSSSYSVKIIKKSSLLFFLKKIQINKMNSKHFTGRGPYYAKPYSVGIFKKYLILCFLKKM